MAKFRHSCRWSLVVVYFDQQTHACACVRMVEKDEKHEKIPNEQPVLGVTPNR